MLRAPALQLLADGAKSRRRCEYPNPKQCQCFMTYFQLVLAQLMTQQKGQQQGHPPAWNRLTMVPAR